MLFYFQWIFNLPRSKSRVRIPCPAFNLQTTPQRFRRICYKNLCRSRQTPAEHSPSADRIRRSPLQVHNCKNSNAGAGNRIGSQKEISEEFAAEPDRELSYQHWGSSQLHQCVARFHSEIGPRVPGLQFRNKAASLSSCSASRWKEIWVIT